MDSWLHWLAPDQLGLPGLFLSALLSATILPGNSELALWAYLRAFPAAASAALLAASLGNTLGSASSVWLGRRMPWPAQASPRRQQALGWMQRWGCWGLLLAWLPLLGDGLCLAAGWLRLPWGPALLAIALGKTARYALLLALAS